MKYVFNIIRSKRRSIAIEIRRDMSILVRAPYRMSSSEIEGFVEGKEAWIEKHIRNIGKRREEACTVEPLSAADIEKLKIRAKKYIPERAAYYAGLMGVSYKKIFIKVQKTRWGSRSSAGNLNFNALLMLAPKETIDYVIVHELCHIKEMNHSAKFWNEVRKILPDYTERKLWLSGKGAEYLYELRLKKLY